MVAGAGLVAAVGDEDHLDLLDVVRHVDTEGGRHDHGVREPELPEGLGLGHSLLAGDHMDGAAGGLRQRGADLVVPQEGLADQLPRRCRAQGCGDAVTDEGNRLTGHGHDRGVWCLAGLPAVGTLLQVANDGVRRDLAPMLVIQTRPLQRLSGKIAPFRSRADPGPGQVQQCRNSQLAGPCNGLVAGLHLGPRQLLLFEVGLETLVRRARLRLDRRELDGAHLAGGLVVGGLQLRVTDPDVVPEPFARAGPAGVSIVEDKEDVGVACPADAPVPGVCSAPVPDSSSWIQTLKSCSSASLINSRASFMARRTAAMGCGRPSKETSSVQRLEIIRVRGSAARKVM